MDADAHGIVGVGSRSSGTGAGLTRLVLPDHLAVLMSGRPYIDVVGPARPWPLPPGWWGHAHARVRSLVEDPRAGDRKSTRLNSSHANISYAVFCLKKKKKHH